MKFWQKIIIFGLICGLSSGVSAKHKKHHHKTTSVAKKASSYTPPKEIHGQAALVAEINHIMNDLNGHASIGVDVKSMESGATLYTYNDQTLFTPASVMKVMTAQAALTYLGAQYKFPTTLVTDATDTNKGVINGNVYLVQTGDPTLSYDDLTDLMQTLRSQQIRGITGDVYIDNTAYDQSNYGPGWLWEDKHICYAAPINASIINHNCLIFQMTPGKSVGQLAEIVANPHYYADIHNEVVTKRTRTRSCYISLGMNTVNAISVSGCMPKGKYTWGISTTIANVAEYTKSLMQNLFKSSGIHVGGAVKIGEAPAHVSAIAIHQSDSLDILVKEMLKMSDNVIAGSLFKKVGEYYTRQPGSWSNGGFAVKQILAAKANLNTSEMSVIDGSGLSRYNKVKPSQMMQVLDYAYHNQLTRDQFIDALPIAGVDGTLKHRLSNVAGKVHAKTGTMKGVVALAGYVETKDKEPIAFVIMVNGRNSVWNYREAEDKIVTVLANYSRN